MTANVGSIDRILRLVIGLALVILPLIQVPAIWGNGLIMVIAMVVGLVLVLTALMRFCPLYRLLGMNTCRM